MHCSPSMLACSALRHPLCCRREGGCKPNFRKAVTPDVGCGPYKPVADAATHASAHLRPSGWHDTISMIVIDDKGNIVAGSSSNGAIHKVTFSCWQLCEV